MKTPCFGYWGLGAGLLLTLFGDLAHAQTPVLKLPAPGRSASDSVTPKVFVADSQLLATSSPVLSQSAPPLSGHRFTVPLTNTLPFSLPLAGTMASPAAGVYQAEPYKMLVLVPEGSLDPNMVVPPSSEPNIRTIRPELKLVPKKR